MPSSSSSGRSAVTSSRKHFRGEARHARPCRWRNLSFLGPAGPRSSPSSGRIWRSCDLATGAHLHPGSVMTPRLKLVPFGTDPPPCPPRDSVGEGLVGGGSVSTAPPSPRPFERAREECPRRPLPSDWPLPCSRWHVAPFERSMKSARKKEADGASPPPPSSPRAWDGPRRPTVTRSSWSSCGIGRSDRGRTLARYELTATPSMPRRG